MLKFGKLFKGSDEKIIEKTSAAENEMKTAEIQADEQVDNKANTTEQKLPDFEVSGELLCLWKRWAEDKTAPVLSLAGNANVDHSLLALPGLEKEALRIRISLEQKAKNKNELIQKREKLGATPTQDAECACFVSKDKLIAWLFVFPPIGEAEDISAAKIKNELTQAGIRFGILDNIVEETAQKKQYFCLMPIALGTPPIEGKDGSVTERYPREISHEVQMDEDGVADYRSLNYVQIINEGDVICDITLPIQGQAGIQVDGKEAKPKPVHAAPVRRGTNTKFSEDGTKLVAAQSGHLEFSDEAFQIQSVLEINGDVDYSTGNIDFPGDVHITGDVRENFTVKAGGSVMIDGLVEAAVIDAEGDLVITKGVVGDNRAILKCRGEIHARFLENCKVYVRKCVYADCIMTSKIFSDDSVSATSGRGSIIGGTMTAAHSIQAKEIGAKSGLNTQIVLGEMPYAEGELQEIEQILETAEKELERYNKDIEYLQNRTKYPEDQKRMIRTKIKKQALEHKCAQAVKEMHEIQILKPELKQCVLECETVYPNTNIKIGSAFRTVEHMQNKYKVRFDAETHEIIECPL